MRKEKIKYQKIQAIGSLKQNGVVKIRVKFFPDNLQQTLELYSENEIYFNQADKDVAEYIYTWDGREALDNLLEYLEDNAAKVLEFIAI